MAGQHDQHVLFEVAKGSRGNHLRDRRSRHTITQLSALEAGISLTVRTRCSLVGNQKRRQANANQKATPYSGKEKLWCQHGHRYPRLVKKCCFADWAPCHARPSPRLGNTRYVGFVFLLPGPRTGLSTLQCS